eukprot:CAMPEP_0184646412 /NCGR_PEP_ID=MMETSP0308-20130426/3121_1 /TAXON_ID=38269 /ORGANISM="Gloeochaete witrockiana, Strain SAG 46.84" /LENGTH=198 /DNA_ID=CAMNT_0027076411 /DNA_START=67 /DNA_END=663 /DNA_ORIENTATION=-
MGIYEQTGTTETAIEGGSNSFVPIDMGAPAASFAHVEGGSAYPAVDSQYPVYAPSTVDCHVTESYPQQFVVTAPENRLTIDIKFLHLISIICGLVSIFTTPLIELVPLIFFIIFQAEFWKPKDDAQRKLCILDLSITTVIFCIHLALQIFVAVITFGFGLIMLPFLIPFVVDITLLSRSLRLSKMRVIHISVESPTLV